MKYNVSRTTKDGVVWKRTKCLDYWSSDRNECWQYSRQGAKQIADRLNAKVPEDMKYKLHYDYYPVVEER